MKILQTSTLLKKTHSFTILNSIHVDIEVTDNPYLLPLEELFIMAARINKRRSFLFVSKVLGKHLPINPNKGLLTGALLGTRYIETIKGIEAEKRESLINLFHQEEPFFHYKAFIPKHINPVVIGFAETATSLGHAFFDCFENADYFHTTREEIFDKEPSITFEEEHSHATSHRCYIPIELIENDREIILVDDEMTTGKTAINIIRSIHTQFPRKEYTIVSILDWRSDEHINQVKQLEEEFGVIVHIVSLLAGKILVDPFKKVDEVHGKQAEDDLQDKPTTEVLSLSLSPFFSKTKSFKLTGQQGNTHFIEETGRFGINSDRNESLHRKITAAASVLKKNRTGTRTLCLGTGEFMYIPMKLAAEMGGDVSYQSTTRSPIYTANVDGYGARYGITFPNPEDEAICHYVYNIPPGEYDELFVFIEREVMEEKLRPVLTQLEKLQIKSIKIVFFAQLEV
ncbi:phosphoribosyltransferase family protein [Bacillus sp. MRMR6]|uniref:phosphoribosyltransferase family protein n=1 Tax=Bacillus sp. MRMR6 TaxID=1928617 RepID=UPI0009530D8B|nr:phosphoribosyltransferase family protein [Bacillus sp. MRMR6]OLS37765.1 hypothetical protein BTR25_15740 [Bacillus sp. MRMR6]